MSLFLAFQFDTFHLRPKKKNTISMSSSTSLESTTINTLRRSGGISNNDDDDAFHFSADEVKQARALLKEKGFDPEDVSKKKGNIRTPMVTFCNEGNLKMCRYLLSLGADCRKEGGPNGIFPMLEAARYGHLDVCQWLYHDGGAKNDIRKQDASGISPLSAALHYHHVDVFQWLTLNGALSSPRDDVDGGVIDDLTIRNNVHPPNHYWTLDKRVTLLLWAQDAVTTHDNFQVFLTGTIIPFTSFRRHPKNEYATRSKRTKVSPSSSSPLVMLKGKSGILELISNYVGTPKPQELRIFRQLIRLLPTFIEDVPEEELDY